MEKILAKTLKYSGNFLGVEEVEIDFGNGKTAAYEVVRFNKDGLGVMIVPRLGDRLLFLEQYQVGLEQRTLVFPRGGVPERFLNNIPEYAKIELQEEIGYNANHLTEIGDIHPMPGYMIATSKVYLAEDLSPSTLDTGDEHDTLKTVPMTWTEANEAVRAGRITDARTLACILLVSKYFT